MIFAKPLDFQPSFPKFFIRNPLKISSLYIASSFLYKYPLLDVGWIVAWKWTLSSAIVLASFRRFALLAPFHSRILFDSSLVEVTSYGKPGVRSVASCYQWTVIVMSSTLFWVL